MKELIPPPSPTPHKIRMSEGLPRHTILLEYAFIIIPTLLAIGFCIYMIATGR